MECHIDDPVWHLDVGSSHPGGGEAPKGSAVRRLKWYVSWVQNVVRQFGLLSTVGARILKGLLPSTRGPGMSDLWCSSRAAKCVSWVAMSRKDKY